MEALPYTVDVHKPVDFDDDSDDEGERKKPKPPYELTEEPERYVLEVPGREWEEPLSQLPPDENQTVRRLQEDGWEDIGFSSSFHPRSSQNTEFSSSPPGTSEGGDRFVTRDSMLSIGKTVDGYSDGEDEVRDGDENSDNETVQAVSPPRETRNKTVFAASTPGKKKQAKEPVRQIANKGDLEFFPDECEEIDGLWYWRLRTGEKKDGAEEF